MASGTLSLYSAGGHLALYLYTLPEGIFLKQNIEPKFKLWGLGIFRLGSRFLPSPLLKSDSLGIRVFFGN
jgi:hypothetical protein